MDQILTNLAQAFAGESQARNRYTMYASIAKKEGYEQVAAIFLETAEQEREHASILYKFLVALGHEAPLQVTTEVPLARGTTAENLKAAITGETYEYETMYPDFAAAALAQKRPDIAAKLKLIAIAETHHAERYAKLLQLLETGYFKREAPIEWTCEHCGYTHTGKDAPHECPLCGHAGFFERRQEEY